MEILICECCGKEFNSKTSPRTSLERVFCSDSCELKQDSIDWCDSLINKVTNN